MHEWGYRYTWPPRMGDLTPRQQARIQLAEHAEAYVKAKQRNQQHGQQGGPGNRSLSHDQYDVDESRREWQDGIQ